MAAATPTALGGDSPPEAAPASSADTTALSPGGRDADPSSSDAPPLPRALPPRWVPDPQSTFYIQLSDEEARFHAGRFAVYIVDLDNSASFVAGLNQRGYPTCYVSAGVWEPGRSDAADFAKNRLGKSPEPQYPDERWIDVRGFAERTHGPKRDKSLLDLMAARLDRCKARGFRGVLMDHIALHQRDTGFSIGAQGQLEYVRALVQLAHDRGLAAGGIDPDPAAHALPLAQDLDFALVSCDVGRAECAGFRPFIERGKALFHAQFGGASGCAAAQAFGMMSAAVSDDFADPKAFRPCWSAAAQTLSFPLGLAGAWTSGHAVLEWAAAPGVERYTIEEVTEEDGAGDVGRVEGSVRTFVGSGAPGVELVYGVRAMDARGQGAAQRIAFSWR
jgi:hypothetical protein